MTTQPAPCSRCQREMSMHIHDPFDAEHGGLRLSLHGMPYLACTQGHKRFVSHSFSSQLIDLVAGQSLGDLPAATKKGLFKKRYRCPECDRELPAAPTGRQGKTVPATLGKAKSFEVTVEVPVFQCEGCGRNCGPSEDDAVALAIQAAGHAFRSIDIHPT